MKVKQCLSSRTTLNNGTALSVELEVQRTSGGEGDLVTCRRESLFSFLFSFVGLQLARGARATRSVATPPTSSLAPHDNSRALARERSFTRSSFPHLLSIGQDRDWTGQFPECGKHFYRATSLSVVASDLLFSVPFGPNPVCRPIAQSNLKAIAQSVVSLLVHHWLFGAQSARYTRTARRLTSVSFHWLLCAGSSAQYLYVGAMQSSNVAMLWLVGS